MHHWESKMSMRIVITGLGVIAPNGVGKDDFKGAIQSGRSGIRFFPELRRLNFRCQVAGVPEVAQEKLASFTSTYKLTKLKSSGILYGCMAAIEAWEDAGLTVPINVLADNRSGCIFGTGSNGIEATLYGIHTMDGQGVRGSDGTNALQAFNSGVSTYIAAILGLGNQVTSNSSACNTGTEAILMAANRIRAGLADRMLVGSSESDSPYVWGPFDSMFATAQGFNTAPEKASRPMSVSAAGFVPSSGAGALIVESLSSAISRGARIYAEVLGGQINSGGHRGDGTMTIGNMNGMIKCIKDALSISRICGADIDLISGHLTSTIGDIKEIQSLVTALGRNDFPYINAMKSMIGHCLSASGSVETVATILQLRDGFIHPSLNSNDLHPEIERHIHRSKIPQVMIPDAEINIAAKISLGFGDVNSCLVLKKWRE